MLIIALIGAIIFYVVVYILWAESYTSIDSMSSFMAQIEKMALAPQHVVFVILRGLILITAFYVVADLLLATSRKVVKKRRSKEEKMQVTYKKMGPQ